jgi:hypothetical protein
MVLDEITKARATKVLETYCEKKVPKHVRDKVRLHFEFRGRNLTLISESSCSHNESGGFK